MSAVPEGPKRFQLRRDAWHPLFARGCRILSAAVLLGIFGGLPLLSPSAGFGAEGESVARAVQGLLQDTWDTRPSPQSRVALDDIYAQHATVPDVRVDQAYALALMRQYRYPDALKTAQRATEFHPDNLEVQQIKLWLQISTKAYGAALAELERSAKLLPQNAPADAKEAERVERDAEQYARFLGRMTGFLEGPMGDTVSEIQLRRVRNAITGQLNQAHLLQFELGRQFVLDEYARLLEEIEKVERTNRTEQKEQKAEQLTQLDQERERRDERRDELAKQQEKLRDELKAELTDIAKTDAPLRDRLARLESQALAIQRELSLLSAEVGRLEARLDEAEDPFLRDSLVREINRLSFLGRRYSGDLSLLEREARRIGGQRATLALRQQQAQAQAGGQFNRAAQEIDEIAKSERKLTIQEKRILRNRGGTSRQARSLAAKADTLSTYDPFPLEEKRRQLLESVR